MEGNKPSLSRSDEGDDAGDDVSSSGQTNDEIDVSVATVATFAALAEPGGAVEAALAHGIDALDPAAAETVGDGVVGAVGEGDGESGSGDGRRGEGVGGNDDITAGFGVGYAGGGAVGGRRGYIFNVCVADHRRREGIAARLLRLAHFVAAEGGVEFMYVHVEKENAAARGLYEAAGYVQESEESEWLAAKLGRPARSLLVLDLIRREDGR